MEIVPACIDDLESVLRLLRAAALPLEGLCDQFPAAYWIASERGRLLGVVGLEQYGSFGLLRSLAVAGDATRRKVGTALVHHALAFASTHVAAVFLLTSTAPDFFSRTGFRLVSRNEVPADVGSSPEFARICPSTAICMMWAFSSG